MTGTGRHVCDRERIFKKKLFKCVMCFWKGAEAARGRKVVTESQRQRQRKVGGGKGGLPERVNLGLLVPSVITSISHSQSFQSCSALSLTLCSTTEHLLRMNTDSTTAGSWTPTHHPWVQHLIAPYHQMCLSLFHLMQKVHRENDQWLISLSSNFKHIGCDGLHLLTL